MHASRAEQYLKILLAVLVVWDVVVGIVALVFPFHVHAFLRLPSPSEPLFTRGVGLYWLFAAYFQFLGWLNARKFAVALQLAIVFRLTAAVLDLAEALVLLPRPFYFLHYTLISFALMDTLIAFAIARLMAAMGLCWIDVSARQGVAYERGRPQGA